MTDGITSIIVAVIVGAAWVALILTPLPYFWRIYKKKTTEQFHPWPYVATQIYSMLCYGYYMHICHDKFIFSLITSFGILGWYFGTHYILVFILFTTERNQVILGWIIIFEALIGMIFVFAALAVAGAPFPLMLSNRASDVERTLHSILEFMTAVSGIIMYGSPFSNIITVYRTKSCKYMPTGLCMTFFFTSFSWLLCASTGESFIPYSSIMNVIGMLLVLLQLKVLHMFPVMPQKSNVVNCVEATLDVDHTEEITVLDTYCAPCKFHIFELDDKIKITPSAEYVLSKDEDGDNWIAREAETASVDEFEHPYKSLPFLDFLRDRQTYWVLWKSWVSW